MAWRKLAVFYYYRFKAGSEPRLLDGIRPLPEASQAIRGIITRGATRRQITRSHRHDAYHATGSSPQFAATLFLHVPAHSPLVASTGGTRSAERIRQMGSTEDFWLTPGPLPAA